MSSAVAPRNDSRASSSPDSSSGSTPSASAAGPKKSVRFVASRAALVAVARTCVTPSVVHPGAVLAQHAHGAFDGVGREAARRVHTLPETRDRHAPVEDVDVRVGGVGAVDVGDEEAHRVRADVDTGVAAGHVWLPTGEPRRASTHSPTGSAPPASQYA